MEQEILNLNVKDLRKRANELGITNYSKFSKAQLAKKVIDATKEHICEIAAQEDATPALKLEALKQRVDELVDKLIEEKRTGVYNQVMKALGGNFYSDLDELLENATEAQLNDALSFSKLNKPKEEPIVESAKSKFNTTSSVNDKSRPREGTLSERVWLYYKEHSDESLYQIAKKFNTYYSVVSRVVKNYPI